MTDPKTAILRRIEMSAPPLDRDQQIELMVNAAERHAAHVARWMKDAQVRKLISTPEADEPTYKETKAVLPMCA